MKYDLDARDYVCCGVVVDKKPSGTNIKLSCTQCKDVIYSGSELEGCPECENLNWNGVNCKFCGYEY